MSVLFDSYDNELKQALKKAKNVMNNFHFGSEGTFFIRDKGLRLF